MGVALRTFADVPPEAWDDFVFRHPQGSLYHGSPWQSLLRQTFGYGEKGIVIIRDGVVCGGVALFEISGFGHTRLASSPFRDRGGILAASDADRALLVEEVRKLIRKGRYRLAVIKEEQQYPSGFVSSQGLQESSPFITTQVDLRNGSEALWRSLKNNAQGPVKQAQALGVTVRESGTERDMDIFYRLFVRTRKELGIPCFSRAFFQRILEAYVKRQTGKLFIAYKNTTPVAGILLLCFKDTVIDGYAASLAGYRDTRANDLLVWTSLAWSCAHGYRRFDFGADSEKQKGLLEFKRKWHGEQRHVYQYCVLSCPGAGEAIDSSEEKYRFARSIMRALPSWVFMRVSSLLVPGLG